MESRNQIEEERKIDINETWLLKKYPEAFRRLLMDHSRPKDENGERHFIIWATDSYTHLGEGYRFNDEITPESITGDNGNIIQPRVSKSKEEQTRRVKDKAEVFTPSWICNAQNNLIDEAWFGRPDVFNREVILEDGTHSWIPTEGKIEFSDTPGRTWQDYVKDIRLEITCGEAPYLASRYDTVSGEKIEPLDRRIGILDRKLRVVGENTATAKIWRKWAREALRATYGYEWAGDNLVLAREAMLVSVFEYHREKFGKEIHKSSVDGLAYIISWNIWQMDGLKYVVPNSCERVKPEDARRRLAELQAERQSDDTNKTASLFGEEDASFLDIQVGVSKDGYAICDACRTGKGDHIGIQAKVRDWKVFDNSKLKKDVYKKDVSFIRLLKTKKQG